jgi:hypothetical protein
MKPSENAATIDRQIGEAIDLVASAEMVSRPDQLGPALLLIWRASELILHVIDEFQKSGISDSLSLDQIKLFDSDRLLLSQIDPRSPRIDAGIDEPHLQLIITRSERFATQLRKVWRQVHPIPTRWSVTYERAIGVSVLIGRHIAHFWGRYIILATVLVTSIALHEKKLIEHAKYHGLIGQYFYDKDFSALAFKRKDLKLDLNLVSRSVRQKLHGQRDNFSVRWTGFLRVPYSGKYTFYTHQDDGASVWIDNKLLISVDRWNVRGSSSAYLAEGFHPIRVDYTQDSGPAFMELYWNKADEMETEIIDSDYFYPTVPIVSGEADSHPH